jgi:hypothetical protein
LRASVTEKASAKMQAVASVVVAAKRRLAKAERDHAEEGRHQIEKADEVGHRGRSSAPG